MPRAAFEAPEYRDAFVAWLKKADVQVKVATQNGHEFVEWEPAKDDVLNEYIGQMRFKCLEEYRARHREAEKSGRPLPMNPCT